MSISGTISSIDSFCLYDYKQRAVEQLHELCQTGSVADYKAEFDALNAQTSLPMEARMFFWNCGLKPHIMAACTLDPATQTSFRDIAGAQKAALAMDSVHRKSLGSKDGLDYSQGADKDPDAADSNGEHTHPASADDVHRSSRKRKCFKCGKPGHIAANCPEHTRASADASDAT